MATAICTNCGERKRYERDWLTGTPPEEWGTIRFDCSCDEYLPDHEIVLPSPEEQEKRLKEFMERKRKRENGKRMKSVGGNRCPKCGHRDTKKRTESRIMSGDTHKVQVLTCPECGWRNL